jgi:hypothetical protein
MAVCADKEGGVIMANFEGVTASNSPKIIRGKEGDVLVLIAQYSFNGISVLLMPDGPDGPDTRIHFYGYDWPYVIFPAENDEDYREDVLEEFLARLALFLAEPMVIHCVGYEKCRFPLSAMEVKVHPDGKIEWGGFYGSWM